MYLLGMLRIIRVVLPGLTLGGGFIVQTPSLDAGSVAETGTASDSSNLNCSWFTEEDDEGEDEDEGLVRCKPLPLHKDPLLLL